MSRCRCASTSATGAAAEDGDCIHITGAGTADSPFAIGTVIDPNVLNLLTCGADGLLALAPDSNIRMLGTGIAVVNNPPPDPSENVWYLQGGTTPTTGEDDGFGGSFADVPFNVAFPTGVLIAVPIGGHTIVGTNPGPFISARSDNHTRDGFRVQCAYLDGQPWLLPLQVDWIAIGW